MNDYTESPEYLESAARVLRAAFGHYRDPEYWAGLEQPKTPLRVIREPNALSVTPSPSSGAPRYSRDRRAPLTERQKAQKAEAEKRRRAAGRTFTDCADCGKPIDRHGTAKRCVECSVKRKRAQTAESKSRLYAQRHGLTGAAAAEVSYDVPAICDALRWRMAEMGASQRAAARDMGMSHDALNHILLGYAKPLLGTVVKLCAWLGVAPETFRKVAA